MVPPAQRFMNKREPNKKRNISIMNSDEKEPSIATPFLIVLFIALLASFLLISRLNFVQELLHGNPSEFIQILSAARKPAKVITSEPMVPVDPVEETASPIPVISEPTPVPVTPEPTIDPGPLLTIISEDGSHSVQRFGHTQLSVTGSDHSKISWSSSDSEIALVMDDGYVYAQGAGSCWINAVDENGVTGAFLLSVTVPVSSIWFPENSYDVFVGYSSEISPVTSPLDATDTSYTLSTDNPKIAQIEGKKILGLSEGRTILRVTAASGASGEVWLNVIPVPVSSVVISNPPEKMSVGQSLQLIAEVLPDDAADPSITWSTGNSYILEVSPTGMLTAHHPGICGIAAKASNGIRAYIEIEITE